MRDKVLIFGGTTEGRELAAALSVAGVQHLVSVATDYGKEIEDSFGEKNVIVGRKNALYIIILHCYTKLLHIVLSLLLPAFWQTWYQNKFPYQVVW